MNPRHRFRRWIPRGILGRSVLIVVMPILLLQAIVAYVVVQRHYDRVTRQLTEIFIRELMVVEEAIEQAEDIESARSQLAELSRIIQVRLRLEPGVRVEAGLERKWYDITGGIAAEEIDFAFDSPIRIVLGTDASVAEVWLQTGKGALVAESPRKRLVSDTPYLSITWSAAASLLLIAIALLFMTNQIRPIRQLANAAEAFGEGREVSLRPRGAHEVRRAAQAFIDMRQRIQRQIERLTLIPMALSHDLGTPITRMRLALELETDREELGRSLDEIDRVVKDFLEFARTESRESHAESDVAELVREVACAHRSAGIEIEEVIDLPGDAHRAPLRPGAMRRCLGNLVENGVRHATRVRITARRDGSQLVFLVEDSGPGIAEEAREKMLLPFSRQELGPEAVGRLGLGLGLAIASDIARLHDGELQLGESEDLGGLAATVTMPVGPAQ